MATISMRYGAALVAGALALAGALGAGVGSGVQEATLKVGDKAPKLEVNEWIKGEAINGLENGHVYVVEYWATWCGPCVRSIPHLNELQAKYKDQNVHFIGVAAFERKGKDTLVSFVDSKGDEMDYRVAYANDGKAAKAWMEAADKRSIPTAFVVARDGTIAYIGSPNDALDKAVEKAAGEKASG